VPALIYLAIAGGVAPGGWGVPVATDIALAVGLLTMLGTSVAASLRSFLLALAVIDDIGAILVIAFVYSTGVKFSWLFAGVICVGAIVGLQKVKVTSIFIYALFAATLWFSLYKTGVHPTLAGVILGLMTPNIPHRQTELEDIDEKLNEIDLYLIKERVSQEGIKQDALIEAGLHRSRIAEIFGQQEQPVPPPQPPPIPPITPEPTRPISENRSLIERIKNKKISVQEIQNSLLDGDISESDLIDSCGLNERMITRIREYKRHGMDPIEFDALPPLKKDCTDFYFLGLPSAGKSCLIASLLSHWLKTGICNTEINNPRSVQYFKQLGGGFSRGILPDSTASSFIDYIELTLRQRITEKCLQHHGHCQGHDRIV
jgi:hypothetical protein